MNPAALKIMLAKGLTLADVVEIAEAMDSPARSSGAERQKRYRERTKSKSGGDVTSDVTSDALLCDAVPLPPSSPPRPPLTPTHTPEHLSRVRETALAKPNGFARFWEAYPSKVGKRDAEKAFERAIKRITGPDPPGQILAGIARATQSRRWREGFIPNPATWLNQDRWTDEESPANDRPSQSPKLTAKQENLRRSVAGLEIATGVWGR